MRLRRLLSCKDAARWYEQRRAGLGLAFVAAVGDVFAALGRWPGVGGSVPGLRTDLAVRRVPVIRFPYYVVYLEADDVVHVLAIAHERRRPTYWAGRAEDP